MKRRSKPQQRTGQSPYAKYGKRPFIYSGWVLDKRVPIPKDIAASLEVSRPRILPARPRLAP